MLDLASFGRSSIHDGVLALFVEFFGSYGV